MRTASGSSADESSTVFHLLSGRNSARWSSSVSVKRPREDTEMSVVIARIGTEDSLASTTPGRM